MLAGKVQGVVVHISKYSLSFPLIGNLTIDRSSVVRIVENITVLEENESSNQVIEISQEEQQQHI